MPLQHTKSGGYRYGPKGHGGKTYYGKGAKAKAARQGRAIALSKARAAGDRVPAPLRKPRKRRATTRKGKR